MASCFAWIQGRNKTPRSIKLVIIGLDDAGKTTIVASLQGEPPDGITPTVGFSNVSLKMGKWNITLYDVGGGNGVRTVWEKYYAEIYGIVFAVDSFNQLRLSEAKTTLQDIFNDPKLTGKPVLVFANKQDCKGALNENDVAEKLQLRKLSLEYDFDYKVFPCSATKGYGKKIDKAIDTGLHWLLESIDSDYLVIHEKVEKEAAVQREIEAKEKKERMERIRKLREERERAAADAGLEEVVEDESDDDVVSGNPFRNINDQIKVTEKREKNSKARSKKIKQHQEVTRMENGSVNRKKKVKKTIELYEEDESDVRDSCLDVPTVIVEQPTPRSSGDEDHVVKSKKKSKRKQRLTFDSPEKNDDNLDEVDFRNPVCNSKKKDNEVYGEYDDFRNSRIIKMCSSQDSDPLNTSSVGELPQINKKYSAEKTEEEGLNDSRAELFRARSSDSLPNTSKNNNRKKKKKKTKRNSTQPVSCTSPTNRRPLPSLPDANGHVSKLQPIKLKGRLPDLSQTDANIPVWARARPNSDDMEIMT